MLSNVAIGDGDHSHPSDAINRFFLLCCLIYRLEFQAILACIPPMDVFLLYPVPLAFIHDLLVETHVNPIADLKPNGLIHHEDFLVRRGRLRWKKTIPDQGYT